MDSLSLGCGEGAFAEPEVPQLPPPAFAVDCSDSDSSESAANDVQGASPSDQAQAEAHGLERCESVGSEDAVTPSGRRRPGRLSWGDHAGEALEHVQTIERRKPRPGLLAHTMAVLKEELYWGFKRPGGEGDAPGAEEAALHDARANALANVAATRGAAPLAASCR